MARPAGPDQQQDGAGPSGGAGGHPGRVYKGAPAYKGAPGQKPVSSIPAKFETVLFNGPRWGGQVAGRRSAMSTAPGAKLGSVPRGLPLRMASSAALHRHGRFWILLSEGAGREGSAAGGACTARHPCGGGMDVAVCVVDIHTQT